eukprot:TRINITY_DN9530_c0_g1_i1.p1 TRINITY_DN9530_c0_g1~~TRINITY_DN9530_c0_g1_i1.p1  ORF type:complete len:170 (-),score=22.97 TRINITY_DN9530_c0_g1_i1:19-528(-)
MSQEQEMTNEVQPTSGAFTLTKQDNGVAILSMDVPGESMNTLKAEFGDEISAMLDDIERDSSIKGVVLTSGKPSSFVAGADITMLAACKTAEDATTIAAGGQAIFDRIENMKATFVAAIHGPALGGGLELEIGRATSELQSHSFISYAVFCLKKKKKKEKKKYKINKRK